MDGRGGEDKLYGIEYVIGGEADDLLFGDAANNILAGGGGDDMLMGGAGADTFIVDGGRDIVRDYNFGEGDRIWVDLGAFGIDGIGDLSVRNGNELLIGSGTDALSVLATGAV